MNALHPGQILKNNFMIPNGITAYRLSKEIGIDQTRLSQIIRGKRAISVDSALRFGRFFRISPEFWLNAQNRYDLDLFDPKVKHIIEEITPLGEPEPV